MRALLIGAVEGTRVALHAMARIPGWELSAVATLPTELASRHSDYVDLRPHAAALEVPLILVANCNEGEFISRVRAIQPDLAFVIGWSQICGSELRQACGGRMIGFHPAPLPRLRGRAAIPWTILLDEKISASSLFWIDEGVDSGPILLQRFFHVAADETAKSLYAKHMRNLTLMLQELLPRLAEGDVAGEVQNESFATWAARRRPSDGLVDWQQPASIVHRLVRAVGSPYPGAFSSTNGKKLVIWEAEPVDVGRRHHALPGQVVARNDSGFIVCCGDGQVLRITRFEAESGKAPAMHSVLGQ